jgi:hypothetical protein
MIYFVIALLLCTFPLSLTLSMVFSLRAQVKELRADVEALRSRAYLRGPDGPRLGAIGRTGGTGAYK